MSNAPFHVEYEIVLVRPSLDAKPLIPWALVALRLLLCPVILAGARAGWSGSWLALAVAIGVVSDIFDGIIARRLGVATPALRRADSTVDLLFWLSVLGAAQFSAGFVSHHRLAIGLLLASEAACQIVSRKRFQKPPATHTYAAKAWGLVLSVGFILALLGHENTTVSVVMLVSGMLVNAEVVAIMALSPHQPVDVASVWPLLHRRWTSPRRSNRSAMFGDRL